MFARHVAAVAAIFAVGTAALAGQPLVDFGRDVRPLLSDHCFACHGPDAAQRQADLRLDLAADLAATVTAGDPDSSILIERVESQDRDLRMPPAEFHKPLSGAQVDTLRRWVEQGAEIESHWSFMPPVKQPGAPADPTAAIDWFLGRRLAEVGLPANGPADQRTLIRRVCLDLTGLPPTRQQLQPYLADDSPAAYERMVDQLLGSHHFGEHFGRFWLDLVRYADTHGLHLDNYREMWPYRDWVIAAFNDNLPYDAFVTTQLAGDLLPDSTVSDLIASGFNRLNVTTNEGGSIYEEVFARNVIDRTDAFGTIFLGLSTGCAVCHDHKFDPLTMKDYYSLSAYFNSLDGQAMDGNVKDHAPVVRVPTAQQSAELAELDSVITQLQRQMTEPIPAVDQAQQAWQRAVLDPGQARTEVLVPDQVTSQAGVEMAIGDDGSVAVVGQAADTDTTTIVAVLPASGHWPTLIVEALTEAADGRVGASPNGNAVLTEIVVETNEGPAEDEWVRVPVARAFADFAQADGPFAASYAIDGREHDTEGWAAGGHQRPGGRTLTLAVPSLVAEGQASRIRVRLQYLSKFTQHQFRRVRLSVSDAPPTGDVSEDMLARIQAAADSGLIDPQVRQYYREQHCTHPDWLALVDQVAGAQRAKQDLENSLATTLVWKELAEPRQAHLLIRGQYDQPGDAVTRDTPGFLPALSDGPPKDRLELAAWLTSPANPLTARVAVNRFWQQLFGTGLVKTSEDFGSQGQPPSHPELLDWLAVDFQTNGWDVKRLIKAMVMSQAYRRDQRVTEAMQQIDPDNRLLARGPRHRLDAEVLRDQTLVLSGLLVDQVGGPSVKPPQPDGLWKAVGYSGSNTVTFTPDEGEKVYRRSVYTFWKRTAPPPQMSTFDAPSRESCTARRERTNTPLQALLLMNEPQALEAARQLAGRAIDYPGSGSPAERIEWLFETVTCRLPGDHERQELVELHADLNAHYRQHLDAAEQLCGVPDPDTAAWTILANTLLNLDEVVTKP